MMPAINIIVIYFFVIRVKLLFGASSPDSDADKSFMRRAIMLASQAIGKTSPNPCVGCIIVDENGTIVGEGWHEKAGEAHAEVRALKEAGAKAIGSTAYVSLEPCNHFGRTPPCSQALHSYGIKRVVAGMVDPDPRVSGGGLNFLSDQGIDVKVGVEEDLCKSLNAPFIFRVLHKRPYVVLWLMLRSVRSSETVSEDMVHFVPTSDEEDLLRELLSVCVPEVDSVLLDSGQLAYLPALCSEGVGRHVYVDALHPKYADDSVQDALLAQVRELLCVHRSGPVGKDRGLAQAAGRLFKCVVIFPTTVAPRCSTNSLENTTVGGSDKPANRLLPFSLFSLETRYLTLPEELSSIDGISPTELSSLSCAREHDRIVLEEVARSGSNALLRIATSAINASADVCIQQPSDSDARSEDPQRVLITESCLAGGSDGLQVDSSTDKSLIQRLYSRSRLLWTTTLKSTKTIQTGCAKDRHHWSGRDVDMEQTRNARLVLNNKFQVISHKLWAP